MESARPKVLIAEDDDHVRELLCVELTRAGFDVHAACDGIEALRQMGTAPYNVLLTDYHMPRMNGLQLLRVVKAWWPQVPVVFVSSERFELARETVAQEIYAWVSKPWDRFRLLETVRAAVQTAATLREGNLTENEISGTHDRPSF